MTSIRYRMMRIAVGVLLMLAVFWLTLYSLLFIGHHIPLDLVDYFLAVYLAGSLQNALFDALMPTRGGLRC